MTSEEGGDQCRCERRCEWRWRWVRRHEQRVLPASATRAVGHQQLVPLLACWAGACFRSGGSDDDERDGKGGGKSGGGSGTARAAAVGLAVASVLA